VPGARPPRAALEQQALGVVAELLGCRGGYYGYRGGYYRGFNPVSIETVNYMQGTLTIDLVDAKQKALAWTATAEGRVSYDAIKNPGSAIDTLVTNMIRVRRHRLPRQDVVPAECGVAV
jgi:hypothetical protein